MPRPLTVFMWGYSGWGNATSDFVASADAVERARGYRPPLFVDVRIHRKVRAEGFKDDKFEKAKRVGEARYRWMRGLGNESQLRKTGRRIKILNPDCAECLLDLIVAEAANRRRILFFCSCELPCNCHRLTVAKLLLAAARRRRQALEIEEWPGGQPGTNADETILRVSDKELSRLRKSASTVPLHHPKPLAKYAGLACGTLITAIGPSGSVVLPVASAMRAPKGWYLPILWEEDDTRTKTTARAVAAWRANYGYTRLRYAPKG